MEDQASATSRRPAHALRVPPPLVTDGDPERDIIDLEEPALSVRDVEWFLFEGNLVLGLIAGVLAVTRDDERHVVQPGAGFPFHADHSRHVVPPGSGADRLQRLLLHTLVWSRD